jgi:hypothetical protein
VAGIDDPGVGAEQLDLEAEELAIVSTRRWLIELQGKEGLAALPKTFTFPRVIPETSELFRQRFVDADLVEVEATVPLEEVYGETASRWPLAVLALFVVGLVLAWIKVNATQPVVAAEGPYRAPQQLTPFSVLALLQRIDGEAGLEGTTRAELRAAIAELERRHFAVAEEGGPRADDLAAVVRRWVEVGNDGVAS